MLLTSCLQVVEFKLELDDIAMHGCDWSAIVHRERHGEPRLGFLNEFAGGGGCVDCRGCATRRQMSHTILEKQVFLELTVFGSWSS